MTIASPSSQQVQEETRSPSQSWGLAITGAIGSGKSTTATILSSLLGWRVIRSGDIARAIDPNTARTGAMADADALNAALLPLLEPGPVLLDGYPRTTEQLAVLPDGFSVVVLINRDAKERASAAAFASGKQDWDVDSRFREQMPGLLAVQRHADEIIDSTDMTPGEVVFTILQSPYIGPPIRRTT